MVDKKYFSSVLLEKGLPLLYGAFGAVITVLLLELIITPQKQLVTVDITKITTNFIREERLKKNMNNEELKNEIVNFGATLQKTLQRFATQNNVILMPREAIISGVPDYTAYIESEINKDKA